jgi:glycerol-3-phosphate dehydrogenase (NAD(P)+)
MQPTITIIGDGAMATVCALVLAENGARVHLLGRSAAQTGAIQSARENTRYLQGYKLPDAIHCTADAAAAFADCQWIVSAIPTQYIRPVLTTLAPHLPPRIPIISTSKGIEIATMCRPSQVIDQVTTPRPIAALSGPSIATEIARRLPATVVIAGDDPALLEAAQRLFSTPTLRVYRNDDLLGVELAGALKNVIAIAAGILDGIDAGNNAKAALLTRGLVEIARLGAVLGAKPETFSGLAGLGDLVTTCVSPEGRNRSFGEKIGRGMTADAALASTIGVVEGVPTCKGVVALAKQHNVPMPLSTMLYHVLFENVSPQKAIRELMTREPRAEGR